MWITKLEDAGKRKVRVFLDEERFCSLYPNEMRELGIRENQEMDADRFSVMQKMLLQRAERKALSLLEYKDRTKKELKDRLLRLEYPEHVVEDAVAYVEFYGYINDEEYVRRYMEYKADSKSRRQIVQELKQKGIRSSLLERIWDEYEYNETEILKGQLERRIRQKGTVTEENFQKYYNYFARKGFSSHTILYLLKKYKQ